MNITGQVVVSKFVSNTEIGLVVKTNHGRIPLIMSSQDYDKLVMYSKTSLFGEEVDIFSDKNGFFVSVNGESPISINPVEVN